jgi:Family of unknown function (DUF6152)
MTLTLKTHRAILLRKNAMKTRLVLIICAIFATSLPTLAHHSFSAEFDDTKPIKVTGVVTKVEWQNPHIWFYVDAKDQSGKVTNWAFSGGAPGQLMRRGITRDVIQPGMTILVEGFHAKDGSNNCSGARVTFPDGRSVFTAGAEDKLPDGKK